MAYTEPWPPQSSFGMNWNISREPDHQGTLRNHVERLPRGGIEEDTPLNTQGLRMGRPCGCDRLQMTHELIPPKQRCDELKLGYVHAQTAPLPGRNQNIPNMIHSDGYNGDILFTRVITSYTEM